MAKRVLVVGTVALDDIETPFGKKERILGGSCTYFALSARHFAPVSMVAAVGQDFPENHLNMFREFGIDTSGLRVEGGKTFRWMGRYVGDMNVAETVGCELNVFGAFNPVLPDGLSDAPITLLGNCAPQTQLQVFHQLRRPEFVMMDTMNFWIDRDREGVRSMARKARVLCINYEEALMLSGKPLPAAAMEAILEMGVEVLIVKKAVHGAVIATKDIVFSLPAYPTKDVVDPTGAGDSFAGGFLGYLAQNGTSNANLKRALVYATVMGSFACEGFGTSRLEVLTRKEIDERANRLISMISL